MKKKGLLLVLAILLPMPAAMVFAPRTSVTHSSLPGTTVPTPADLPSADVSVTDLPLPN